MTEIVRELLSGQIPGKLVPGAMPDQKLTREEAAELLGVTKGTLATWASTGRKDLPYYSGVGRRVFYLRREVEKWIAQQRTTFASECRNEQS